MFDAFRKYLADKISLTDQQFELIESVAVIKKLRKRQYLLQEGDVWRYNAFVCKGFLRAYFVDSKGVEHIMQFAPGNHWTGDRESLASGLPSKYNIEAIENSEVLMIKEVDFKMLCKEIPVLHEFANTLTQKNVLVLQERIHENITHTAEEKYFNFLKKFPAIANRVPLHMIASYLGVSAETLSRIRNQSSKK